MKQAGTLTLSLAAGLLLAISGPQTARAAGNSTAQTTAATPTKKPLAQTVESRKQAGSDFKAVALFGAEITPVQSAATKGLNAQAVTKAVAQSKLLPMNQTAVADLLQKSLPTITLSVPTSSRGTVQLELYKQEILSPNFQVLTSDGRRFSAPKAAHYRGVVKGDPESRAAVSVFDNEVMGFFSSGKDYHVIGRLNGPNPTNTHIVYEHHDLKWEPPTTPCGMDTSPKASMPHGSFQSQLEKAMPDASAMAARCVELYVETEYDIFQSLGSVSAVTNYVTGVFNQVNVLYANAQIPMSGLSQVYVWTSSDPYNTMSENRLYDFTRYRTSFKGTFGSLWTFENIRSMAYDINTYCQASPAYRSAFCGLWGGSYSNVPTYSWTVYIIAHELGHLFGSEHTHACVWNGNNTAIDGCSGYVEYGSCSLPSNPACGTIMSYCTYCIDFNEGFGAQPGQKLRTKYQAASCVPATCGGSCTYTVTPSTASFNSTGGSGSVSVTTSASCNWTATSDVSWITVTTGSGTGNGTVRYSVDANNSGASRTGTVTISGQTHTVSQAAGNSTCNYAINPTSASYTVNGGSGTVSVTANSGCTWTASSTDSWITVSGSGTGNGTVSYTVAANSSAARTGTMTIAGQTFTVSQAGSGNNTCTTYTGTLSAGGYDYQPNGNWYYASKSGVHQATLTGPSGTNFDLELYQSTASGWIRVAGSNGSGSNETVSYNGAAGYYYWQVMSVSGSGSYSLCVSTP